MSRSAEQVRDAWVTDLLPSGKWARGEGSNLSRFLLAFAVPLAGLEEEIDGLRAEISPRDASALLSDYEAVLGPDPCGRDVGDLSIAQRRSLAFQRWVASSGVSCAFFKRLAEAASVTIEIIEPELPVHGPSRCGVQRCGTMSLRFTWVVRLPNRGTGLECPMRRLAPADTMLIFEYEDDA